MLAACLSRVFMVWLGLGTKGDELDYLPGFVATNAAENVANLVKSNQWLHAYMVYVDTASQTVVSGLETSTKCHFCCRKCGWKCQKYPVLSSVNTAGHVAMSHQKCR